MKTSKLALLAIRIAANLEENDAIAYLRDVKQAYPAIFAEILRVTCAMEVKKPAEPGRYAKYAHLNQDSEDL